MEINRRTFSKRLGLLGLVAGATGTAATLSANPNKEGFAVFTIGGKAVEVDCRERPWVEGLTLLLISRDGSLIVTTDYEMTNHTKPSREVYGPKHREQIGSKCWVDTCSLMWIIGVADGQEAKSKINLGGADPVIALIEAHRAAEDKLNNIKDDMSPEYEAQELMCEKASETLWLTSPTTYAGTQAKVAYLAEVVGACGGIFDWDTLDNTLLNLLPEA